MKPIIPFALLGALLAVGANAATTDPVGYVTIPIPGTDTTGTSPSALQLASQQLLPGGSTEFAGAAESFGTDGTGTFLQDDDGTWSAGDYVNASPPAGFPAYSNLVEVTSGPLAGTYSWITGTDANKIYTFDDISAAGADAAFRVVRAFTISSLLGADGGPLNGAGNASAADNLLLFNSVSNTYTTFYYKSSGVVGGTGWRSSASNSVDVASVAIHPNDSGLVFVRKQAADTELVVAGDVKVTATDVVVRGGGGTGPSATTLNIVQALTPVSQITLGTSGLYTGDSATGLAGAGNASSADNVLVFDAATNTYTTYYYKSSGVVGGTGWRSSASNSVDESGAVLPSTSAILIQRKANAGDFTWTIPAVTVEGE